MRLAFLPGDLFLLEEDGLYIVRIGDRQILSSKSRKRAINEFNKIRQAMEAKFPDHDLTVKEKKLLLEKAIADSLGYDSRKKRPCRCRTYVPRHQEILP